MKFKLFTLTLLCSIATNAQVSGPIIGQEFSKEISLYKAKAFLITEILKTSEDAVQFEVFPLAAANSGELTSLVYQCKSKNVEGLILGFYGKYWNESGVFFQGYSFRNFPKDNAISFLDKISKCIEQSSDYLSADLDNNNTYFQYEDIVVLICKSTDGGTVKLRVLWGEFEADWEATAFNRTKKRFEKRTQ